MKKKRKSARSAIYWFDRGFEFEVAKMMAMSRMPGTVEYFCIFKSNNWNDSIRLSKEYQTGKAITLHKFLSKYGEVEGRKRWDQYREKQRKSNLFEYKAEKHGWTKDEYNAYNASRAQTLENMIARHGEEVGLEKWNAYVETQRYAGTSKQYFIDTYGLVGGVARYLEVNSKKALTFDGSLIRCGGDFEAATEDYNRIMKSGMGGYSKISLELFDVLHTWCGENGVGGVYFHGNPHEWFINKSGKSTVFLDFFVRSVGKCIEFHGDFWHGNPDIYPSQTIMNYPGTGQIIVNELWKRDDDRLMEIRKMPYIRDVKIVWESDFRNNPEKVIKECILFLQN